MVSLTGTLNPKPGELGLYPQALGTLLRHAWATVGLFFNPGH